MFLVPGGAAAPAATLPIVGVFFLSPKLALIIFLFLKKTKLIINKGGFRTCESHGLPASCEKELKGLWWGQMGRMDFFLFLFLTTGMDLSCMFLGFASAFKMGRPFFTFFFSTNKNKIKKKVKLF